MEEVPTPTQNRVWMAYVSLALGVFSLCAWFIPLVGCPINIGGIVLGYLGKDTDQKALAWIGLGLSALGFIATIVNAALGAYLGATGQHSLINQFLGQ